MKTLRTGLLFILILVAAILISGSSYHPSPIINYGEMWFHNDSIFYTNVITQNTPTTVACFDSTTNGQLMSGFTYTTSSLTAKVAGKYLARWTTSFGSSTSNNKHHFWLAVSGVEEFNTESHCKPVNSTDVITCTGSGILTLAINNVVTLVVMDETAGETFTVFSANVNLQRIDN